jgi:hypothetical protein
MRNLNLLDRYRLIIPGAFIGDRTCGAFEFSSKTDGQSLRVIASSDCGWDHVSVSRTNRCPNWPEMEQVRRLFFKDEEAAMQYHAPVADYVDGSKFGHPFCLHLWRPHGAPLPVPPKWMVGGMHPDEAEKQMQETMRTT